VLRRLALLVVLALVPAADAQAATFCVDVVLPGCIQQPSVAAALVEAQDSPGLDTIRVGRRREEFDVTDAPGEPVRVIGAGRGLTELGRADLGEDRSSVSAMTVRATVGNALAVRGSASDLEVEGRVRLRDGSALRSSSVAGEVVTAGRVRMHSVAVTGPGLDVESGTLTAAHLTLLGSGAAGVRVPAGAGATLANSVVWGFASGGRVTATFSHLPESGVDPGFAAPPGDLSLRADSPLVDAGDPRPLDPDEPESDALGAVRAMDGDGDGSARRDVGAAERRPPPPPPTAGNLLANPGAEQGTAAQDDSASPAPPRWRRTGGFTSVRYGTVVGLVAFPTLDAASLLGAGDAFFAGGPSGAATATQVVDVSGWAPEIDGRAGVRMRLSALLGGYRLSDDRAVVSAHFRGPSGARLGGFSLDSVTAAERGNATMLLARLAGASVPRLTRSVAVTVRSGTPGGSYNDAYADDIALVPRVRPLAGVPPRRARGRRPFGGVAVISRRVRVARGRARVRIACPSASVRRCAGMITLARRSFVILGSRQVALRPGESQRVRIPLSRRERRRLRRRSRGHVYSAVRDGQGLTRTATAPVRIVRR
jgi:hypothetical protein